MSGTAAGNQGVFSCFGFSFGELSRFKGVSGLQHVGTCAGRPIRRDGDEVVTSVSQIYYHGEPISVNVHVTNNTNKTVKKMKISGTSGRQSSLCAQLTVFLMAGLCLCSATVCRYLPVQHGAVQMSRGHRGIRVSSSPTAFTGAPTKNRK